MATFTDYMQIDRKDDGDAVALIRPEQLADIMLATAEVTPDTHSREYWKASMLGRLQDDGDFYGHTAAKTLQELTAGELVTPPRPVEEVSEMIASDLVNLGTRNRRTRHHAEDGEIDVARWIDDRDRCFTRRRRTPKPYPIVNVIANFGFSFRQPLKAFQNQAIITCATCKALESLGFSTNVIAVDAAREHNTFKARHILYPIKAAGTPLNAAQIWTYTRREVSRRMFHNATAAFLYAMGDPFNAELANCDTMKPSLYADLLPGTSLIFEASYQLSDIDAAGMAELIKNQIDDAKIIAQDEL